MSRGNNGHDDYVRFGLRADGNALDGCMKNAALLRGVSRINIEQSFGLQTQRALIHPLIRPFGANDFETLILSPPPSNAALCI
jgi:hypothetical protein